MSINKVLGLSAVLVFSVVGNLVFAEEGDMTQTRTQERVHAELNMQDGEGEGVRARVREQKMEQHKEKLKSEVQSRARMESRAGDTGSMMRERMMHQRMTDRAMRAHR